MNDLLLSTNDFFLRFCQGEKRSDPWRVLWKKYYFSASKSFFCHLRFSMNLLYQVLPLRMTKWRDWPHKIHGNKQILFTEPNGMEADCICYILFKS